MGCLGESPRVLIDVDLWNFLALGFLLKIASPSYFESISPATTQPLKSIRHLIRIISHRQDRGLQHILKHSHLCDEIPAGDESDQILLKIEHRNPAVSVLERDIHNI